MTSKLVNDYMTLYECQRSRSFIDLGPRSLDSTFSNFFFLETAWPIEAKFYVEPQWDGGKISVSFSFFPFCFPFFTFCFLTFNIHEGIIFIDNHWHGTSLSSNFSTCLLHHTITELIGYM